jgi:predicted aspartyl protease
MINRGLAEKLGLKELSINEHVEMHDSAGASLRHYVHVDELRLNDMKADDLDFIVMGEDRPMDPRLGGIFGATFLAAYDVEFDIPHGKINLFTKNHCKDNVVYWTKDYDALPFTTDISLHPVLRASLDGHEMSAILDTGATPSVLSARTARFVFGLDPIASGDKPDGQVFSGSGSALPIYKHRFGTLEIGGVQFHNTEFDIMPDKTTREIREHQSNRQDLMPSETNAETPLTIGLHHLSRLRVFLAYSERMIYISAGDAN